MVYRVSRDYARGSNGCGARDEGLGREGGSDAD